MHKSFMCRVHKDFDWVIGAEHYLTVPEKQETLMIEPLHKEQNVADGQILNRQDTLCSRKLNTNIRCRCRVVGNFWKRSGGQEST